MLKKLVRFLFRSELFHGVRRCFGTFLAKNHMTICSFRDPRQAEVIDLIRLIKKERKMLMGYEEAYNIHMATVSTEKIKGDIAEVGVYGGGSSRIICQYKKQRVLHLFDTFEGLPEGTVSDGLFKKGQFKMVLDDVKNYLKDYKGVFFYKGVFPESAAAMENAVFSFANIDVDTYKSTRGCLEFLYPRMSRGGIIISHDYQSVPEVRNACDEFFADKPEPLLEMTGTQCMAVKL